MGMARYTLVLLCVFVLAMPTATAIKVGDCPDTNPDCCNIRSSSFKLSDFLDYCTLDTLPAR